MGRHGQGTIYRRPNGRYAVAVTMTDGRRLWRSAPDRKTADARRRELVALRDADVNPSGQSVADFLRSWTAGLDGKVRPRTAAGYRSIVENHLIPALGLHSLTRLGERDVQRWVDASRLSPQTVRHHHACLRRALTVAYRQRLVVRNVAIGVDLPRVAAFSPSPLTAEQARRLLEATVDDRLGPLWRLALATGLRQGELLGLAWDDVDLDAGRIEVRHSLARIDREWQLGPTKAARTLPVIRITGATLESLRRHRARMAAERTPEWKYWGLVFVSEHGRPLQMGVVLNAFHAALARAGLPRIRFHDLRGSAATLMAESGVPEATRMARLGHTTTAMARHYAIVREGLDAEAAEKLERLLG